MGFEIASNGPWGYASGAWQVCNKCIGPRGWIVRGLAIETKQGNNAMAHIDDMPYKAFKKFVQQFAKVMVDIPRCEGSIEVTKKAIIEYCQYYDNQINVMYQPDFSVIYVQPYLDKR